jgi:hypothetical protein
VQRSSDGARVYSFERRWSGLFSYGAVDIACGVHGANSQKSRVGDQVCSDPGIGASASKPTAQHTGDAPAGIPASVPSGAA